MLLGSADPATGAPRNLWLVRSDDGGTTWTAGTKVNGNDNVFWYTTADMAVDDTGRIFVVWDRQNGQITYARSIDQGANFSYQVMVGAGGSFGVSTVTAHCGVVVVAWDTDFDFANDRCGPSTVRRRRSTDGGATFGTAANAKGSGNCLPELSIARSTGHVLLTHRADAVTGRLALSKSTNSGSTFGSSVRIHDATRIPILPALIEETTSNLYQVGWVEADPDSFGEWSFADNYGDRSTNGGAGFGTDLRITGNETHPDRGLQPGSVQWDLAGLASGEIRRVMQEGIVGRRQAMYIVSNDGGVSYTQPQPMRPPVAGFDEAEPVVELLSSTLDTVAVFTRIERGTLTPTRAYFCRTRVGSGSVGDVTNLRFNPGSRTTLSWNAATGATSYDVARGTVSVLRSSGSVGGAAPLSCEQAGTTLTDAFVPAISDGSYYLVRGRDGASKGSFGQPALRDSQLDPCP